MVIILLALLLFPALSEGYEHVWGTDFTNEEGYGYYGNELNLPTDEWFIDLRGVSLETTSNPSWFRVDNGILEGTGFKCSYQLNTNGVGIVWKSRIISLDPEKTYYADFHLGTSDNWDGYATLVNSDFVRIGYYDMNEDFIQIFENSGDTARNKFTGIISNTQQCQLVVEVDCNAQSEIFRLLSANLYYDSSLGDNSELIITKLAAPADLNLNNRYIQITNISDHLINLEPFSLDAIYRNGVRYTWDMSGIILPRKSLVIGDLDASMFICDIGKPNWSRNNTLWTGEPQNNDGGQLVIDNTREITDKVVGLNFYQGFVERKSSSLLASEETDLDGWTYQSIENASESLPGTFIIDETLPISLYNTNFTFNNFEYMLNWTTAGESNLIGYNLFFAQDSNLASAVQINPQIILAQNSVQSNHYSYPLSEIDSPGFLWIEAISIGQAHTFSEPIIYSDYLPDETDIIEIVQACQINVFPNPTTAATYIKVKNSQETVTEINIYNLKGQLVGQIIPRSSSDSHNITAITKNLSSGIYFVATKFPSKIITKKLILTK